MLLRDLKHGLRRGGRVLLREPLEDGLDVETKVFRVKAEKTSRVDVRRELVVAILFQIVQAFQFDLGGARGDLFGDSLFRAGLPQHFANGGHG